MIRISRNNATICNDRPLNTISQPAQIRHSVSLPLACHRLLTTAPSTSLRCGEVDDLVFGGLSDGETFQHLNLPAGGHRLAAALSRVKPSAWVRRLQYTVVETCRAKSNPASDIRAVPRIWWLSQRPIVRPGSVRSTAFHDNVYGIQFSHTVSELLPWD